MFIKDMSRRISAVLILVLCLLGFQAAAHAQLDEDGRWHNGLTQAWWFDSHTPHARELIGRLAATNPTTLACVHGSAWRGNGAALLRALADELTS